MYNEVITLIAETFTVSEFGDLISNKTRREVFAKLASIGTNEFYTAQSVGLKPELKFILPDFLEYQGEQLVEYTVYGREPELYSVLRTFRNGNELELTCKRGID